MIWSDEISFDGFQEKVNEWYKDKEFELCDPPIDAQFALDLIFKMLIDDKYDYPYLTTMPETTEQTNSIMLDLILRKYSRAYRKHLRKMKLERRKEGGGGKHDQNLLRVLFRGRNRDVVKEKEEYRR